MSRNGNISTQPLNPTKNPSPNVSTFDSYSCAFRTHSLFEELDYLYSLLPPQLNTSTNTPFDKNTTFEQFLDLISQQNEAKIQSFVSEYPFIISKLFKAQKDSQNILEFFNHYPTEKIAQFTKHAISQLNNLYKIDLAAKEVMQAKGLEELTGKSEEALKQSLGFKQVYIFTNFPENGELTRNEIVLKIDEGLIGRAFKNEGFTIIVPSKSEDFNGTIESFIDPDLQTVIYTHNKTQFIGQLEQECTNEILVLIHAFFKSTNSLFDKFTNTIHFILSHYKNSTEYNTLEFDIFKLNYIDRFAMLLKFFEHFGFYKRFSIAPLNLLNFLIELKSNYTKTHYHSWTHACDVSQYVYRSIVHGALDKRLTDVEILALLMAAVCHDVGHRGLNNAFHRNAKTPLGVLYEGKPVMEMHHTSFSLNLLKSSKFHFFKGFTKEEKNHFCKTFVKVILATDMEKHQQYLKDFTDIIGKFDQNNEDHRVLLAQVIIKCADLSNTVRPFSVAKRMAEDLTKEFFRQGDKEKELGLTVSKGFDRETAGPLSQSQIGFYTFVAKPLIQKLSEFDPLYREDIDTLTRNLSTWTTMAEEETAKN